MKKTNNYAPFEVIDRNFASGGNAKILLVQDKKGKKYALKSIKINSIQDAKKVNRFLNEINIVEKFQDKIQGIIPLRYKSIPEKIKDEFEYTEDLKGNELWYVMELAEPIFEKLGTCDDLEVIIDCLISLSKTLVKLHSHRIVHRDIKPSNIYYHRGEWAFGDFGLVAYPDFEDNKLTGKDERVGNYATIAPEMRRAGQVKDARPADVWSLAKTLWMLITKNESYCFEGSYNRKDEAISISKYWKEVPITLLHDILESATRYEEKDRVDINQFSIMLMEYKELLVEKKSILSYEELQALVKQSEDGRIYRNSADSTVDTIELIEDFHFHRVNQELKFLARDLADEVDILKYIKMKLEFFSPKKYIVSPIIEHFRNESMPAIKIFVNYTETKSKFVTFIVCADKEVHIFNQGYIMSDYYDTDGLVDYSKVDHFINLIDSISMKSIGRNYK
ncbi:protein kinase domain-containing protein [Paenibacillus ihuae]|uniref:protein kinase domain-containing protein n=1 Tax=Paenibacillus ihuae TaxID=1232431 RepID=UPI0006D555AB|nr:protein kinase [Paenibacillus ihuae]